MFWRWPLVALGLWAAVAGDASAQTRYLPDSGGGARDDIAFYERWFGRQLRAMREPALRDRDDLGGYRRRFRLLVLPSFTPAYAYRVDERAGGRATLRWVMLDGAGGYRPGRVAHRGNRLLTASEADELWRAITDAGLNALPRRHGMERGVLSDDDAIIVCGDGIQYVLELLDRDRAVFLTRHQCEIRGVATLERLLDVTSRLQPMPQRSR